MKTTPHTTAKEKAMQYGAPAMTERELLDILKFKGTTEDYYKSIQFKAAIEMSARRISGEKPKITHSRAAYEMYRYLDTVDHEQFHILLLNRRNLVVKQVFISKGNETGTVVSTKEIAKQVIDTKATSIVLVHNHPSGNPSPSEDDKRITTKIKTGLSMFDCQVIDHVIIGDQTYFSFADEGII